MAAKESKGTAGKKGGKKAKPDTPKAMPPKKAAAKPPPKKPSKPIPKKAPPTRAASRGTSRSVAVPLEDLDATEEDFREEVETPVPLPIPVVTEEAEEAEEAEEVVEPPPPVAAPPPKREAAAHVATTSEPADEEEEVAAPEGAPAAKPKPVIKVPPMPPRRSDGKVTVAYSPDADDAFMMYALENSKTDNEGRGYVTVRADIQALNEEARKGTHDVTALSFAAYPQVYDRYVLLPCGCSFGDGEGPILVAKTPVRSHEVDGMLVAVPGPNTTAVLALRLWLPRAKFKLVPTPFDQIGALVKSGKVRAGLLIHEGQLTWREEGFVKVVDLGRWWGEKTEGLPLPLGANAVRRDIPPEQRTQIALDLKRSIAYGLGHRDEALQYATKFARGMDKAKVDKYVQMYVNELTLDLGERGRQASRMLLDEGHRAGLLPKVDLDFE